MTTAKEHQEQGIKLYEQQDYEASARAFQQAHETYDAGGEKDMAAEMEVNIGLVHRALGENQQALDIMQTALRTFQSSGDTLRAAKVMGNLGGVYMELGDREQAYNCYRQAADAFQELGEKILYGETLIAMGRMQVREGNVWVGAATYEAGLEQLDKLSGAQKVLKSLIGIKNRLSGGKPS
ncbi:MAG: tetratricopeptide repeat protein [Chitinophagaceae bacterium]|nr:tetratricopeptide repeat protein [Anaerolineae bacterium]